MPSASVRAKHRKGPLYDNTVETRWVPVHVARQASAGARAVNHTPLPRPSHGLTSQIHTIP